ncbi:MAG: sigma 54-interacting transcriptional regulator [Archangium sp.]|nr:sigma 54-interacting transcriptional regulator [Archangium sp.]MDP3574445.1 sigma 54-interacting transcriptional regulator [Archangium sp.]
MNVELVATSLSMRHALSAALDVASTPTTVLLTGETGTGKEVLARFIHQNSQRSALPFTVIASASIDLEQVEAALRHGGTVLFDEIGSIPMETQGRLLSLLEGAHPSRVIATSHRDLQDLVGRGQLRSDLYYRLDVFPIVVPSLRDRKEDIAPLADLLLQRAGKNLGRQASRLTAEALGLLESQRWPGNVRELANVLERASIRSRGPMIEGGELGLIARPVDASFFPTHLPLNLDQLERLAIVEALRRTAGNRTHAARLLNIGLRTLRQKLNTESQPTELLEVAAP